MANEPLTLHITVNGKDAMGQIKDLVKQMNRELGGVKVDFSGKAQGKSFGSAFSKGMQEASRRMKEETRQFKTEMESNLREQARIAEQAARQKERLLLAAANKEAEIYRRLGNHMRVHDSRMSRSGSFDPLAPFMDSRLSGRGLSQRAKNALIQHKQVIDQAKRDALAIQREQERAARDLAKRNAKHPLNILSMDEMAADQKAAWWADLDRKRKERERMQEAKMAADRRIMSRNVKNSFRNQRENEQEQRRVEAEARRAQLAEERRMELDQRRNMRSRTALARQREREEQNLQKAYRRGGDYLTGSILNPNYHTKDTYDEYIQARTALVRENIQGPRLARQEQARRSQYLASLAYQGRNPNVSRFGPMQIPSGPIANPNQKAIAEMFGRAGIMRAEDMRKMNRGGRMSGMGLMGLYQIQQMYEDYQYAGIRGLGNNAAFLGASIGGPVGAGIIGATFAMQLGEMTYKMLGYADAEEKAARAAEKLTRSQMELIEVSHNVGVRFASGEAATERKFGDIFENPAKKVARQKLIESMVRVQSQGKGDFVSPIQSDAVLNPEKYLDYASGLGGDVAGIKEKMRDSARRAGDADMVLRLMEDVKNKESAYQRAKTLHSLSQGEFGVASPESVLALEEARKNADRSRNTLRENIGIFPQHKSVLNTLDPSNEFSGTAKFAGVVSALQKQSGQYSQEYANAQRELSDVRERIRTPVGSARVAQEALAQAANGDRTAQQIVEPFAKGNEEIKKMADELQRVADAEKEAEHYASRRKDHAINVRDAESEVDRLLRSQLSTAENMVESQKRKAQSLRDARQSSSDSFAGRMFGINRDRTSDFLQKQGAPEWYIQQQDDALVGARLMQLRGAANAAGKAGNIDRQIDMLKELQALQMQMASSDDRFNVAKGFYNESFATQAEIEAAYQKQSGAATSQQQAWQGVVNSLQQAQNIKIDPMSPDALPKLQQYLAMLQQAQATMIALNPGLAQQYGQANAAASQAITNTQVTLQKLSNSPLGQAQYDLFGGFARGGMIHGRGRNDTVNARLQPLEYVIKADVVKRLGASTFDHINRTGRLPRMAQGGLAGMAGMPVPIDGLSMPAYYFGDLVDQYWRIKTRRYPTVSIDGRQIALQSQQGDMHPGPEVVGLPLNREVREAQRVLAKKLEESKRKQTEGMRNLMPGSQTYTPRGMHLTELQKKQLADLQARRRSSEAAKEEVRRASEEVARMREESRRKQDEGMRNLIPGSRNWLPRGMGLTPSQEAQLKALRERREQSEYLKKMWEASHPKPPIPGFTMGGAGAGVKPGALAANRGRGHGRARPRNRWSGYNYGYINPWSTADDPGASLFQGIPGYFPQGGTMLPPLFMAAPVIENRTFSGSGGFADRLLHGNYSGDQNNIASWWATLSSKRFANMGGSFGHGIRSLGGATGWEDMSWLGRGYRGRRRTRGGFHAFAQGGLASPVFATPGYAPPIEMYTGGNRTGTHVPGGGMPGPTRSTTTNRSTIGAINITVTGSGGAAQVVNDARRAEYASRLRRG